MSIAKLIFIDTLLDLLSFPLWWYSKGVLIFLKWVGREVAGLENMLGIWIWVKNIFAPMFGQRDWQGKIISFFMRLFQIIFRSIAFLGFNAFYFLLFGIYLLLPLATFYGIAVHWPAIEK